MFNSLKFALKKLFALNWNSFGINIYLKQFKIEN